MVMFFGLVIIGISGVFIKMCSMYKWVIMVWLLM